MRQEPMKRALKHVGTEMVSLIRDQAERSGDNIPRHVKTSSRRAGKGYTHYEDNLEVHIGVYARGAALFVIGNRHAIYTEFGYTTPSGRRMPPKLYMRNALRLVRWV